MRPVKTAAELKAAGRAADRHWKEVMALAEKYGFLAQVCDGTALLITHQVQLEAYGERGYLAIQRQNGHCARTLGYPGCLSENETPVACGDCGLAVQKD